MKKILICNDLVHSGGVEKVMEEIVKYLLEKKYDITMVTIENDVESIREFYPSYIHYYSIKELFTPNIHKRNTIKHFVVAIKRRLRKIRFIHNINREHFDIVIAIKEGTCTKLLASVKAKKKISWIHVDYQYLYWTKYVYNSPENEIKCMKKYNNIVCVTKAAKQSVCKVIGDPGNLIVKMNPMDVNYVVNQGKKRNRLLEEYKRDNQKVYFIAVGGLREQKGYLRLLECCAKLSKQFAFELWIVGEGEERKKIEEKIKEENLKNIILWGNQDNPYPFIKKADWFISASYCESYGIAIQEALILNTPVLATKCEAIEECVSENEAILVENSMEGIYSGLYNILKDKTLRDKYINQIDNSRNQKEMYYKRLEEIEQLWL